jgi:hypothetical protein
MDLSDKVVRGRTRKHTVCQGERLEERQKCFFCGGYDKNSRFIGLDPDLTGKWLCTLCRPCSICGDYDEDAACIGPDLTGNWYCSNCPEGEVYHMERSTKIAPPQSRGTKCAVCHKSFANSHIARRHEKESKTCGTKEYLCSVSGCGKGFRRKGHLKRHLGHHRKYLCKFKTCEHNRVGHDLGSISKLKRHLKSHAALPEKRDSISPLPSQDINRISFPDYALAAQLPADYMFSNLENVNKNWADLVEGYTDLFLEADENSTCDSLAGS